QIVFWRAVYSLKIIYDVIAAMARTDLVIKVTFGNEAWFATIFAYRIVKVVIRIDTLFFTVGIKIKCTRIFVVIHQFIAMVLAFGDLVQQITLQIIQIKMSPSVAL